MSAFAAVHRRRRADHEAVAGTADPSTQRPGSPRPRHSTTFHRDFVTARDAKFGLSVFLRDGDDIFQTYFTTGRGVEYASTFRALADLTPYGRGEDWEDSPRGWPQVPTHSWERLNDQY